MTKTEFASRFKKAVDRSIKFAGTFVTDDLPDSFLINLYNRDRSDNNLRLSLAEAVEKLYRSEGVPRWVNLSIAAVDNSRKATIIECEYSDIFYSDDSKLDWYGIEPTAPFRIGGTSIPPGYETTGKATHKKKFQLMPYDEKKGWIKRN